MCGLFEVILHSSGSAPPVPPCTKAEVQMLGCCSTKASSTSPGVLACLLIVPSASGHCTDRQLALICHPG
ncbi:hypothetical protein GDO81_006405 [Engystomops pustulosus]|uniref:Uncharacterized protein n=1 Tax=Engystomops pustulosus TaxID=76066 RepID=A0AAV7CWF1_ENGPU|nr:hypothetical protein GDO81_006405 [Engystomops pustulosus]